MIGFLLGLAVLAAVVAVGVRRWQRTRAARRRPGATIHRPVAVRSFDEIDTALQGRTCWCGGFFVLSGETSRSRRRPPLPRRAPGLQSNASVTS